MTLVTVTFNFFYYIYKHIIINIVFVHGEKDKPFKNRIILLTGIQIILKFFDLLLGEYLVGKY